MKKIFSFKEVMKILELSTWEIQDPTRDGKNRRYFSCQMPCAGRGFTQEYVFLDLLKFKILYEMKSIGIRRKEIFEFLNMDSHRWAVSHTLETGYVTIKIRVDKIENDLKKRIEKICVKRD